MKKSFILFFITTGLIALAATNKENGSQHKSAGPPGCYAGEPPNNTNCTSCHSDFPVNSGSATILFDLGGADTGYVQGATYNMKISVKKTGLAAAGFLFTALQNNDITTTPGTITLNDAVRTQKIDPSNPHVQGCALLNKVYVEHTYQGHTSNGPGENSWDFKWQAPSSNVGDITFYLATVESNYSGDEFGDYVYTKKVISKSKATNVSQQSEFEAGTKIYPNPAISELYVSTNVVSIQSVDLVNVHGMKVRQFVDLTQSNKGGIKIDLNGLAPGMYFIGIHAKDMNVVRQFVIQE